MIYFTIHSVYFTTIRWKHTVVFTTKPGGLSDSRQEKERCRVEKDNQRVRLTKRLLKETLAEKLAEKPINRITVREICQGAGINRSTFYLHYADQYALLDEIERDILNELDDYVGKIRPESDGRQYLVALIGYIRHNGRLLSTLMDARPELTFQSRFTKSVLNKISTREPGLPESELMTYFTQFLVMGNIGIIRRWIKNDFDLPDETVAEMIFCLSDNAVCTFGELCRR